MDRGTLTPQRKKTGNKAQRAALDGTGQTMYSIVWETCLVKTCDDSLGNLKTMVDEIYVLLSHMEKTDQVITSHLEEKTTEHACAEEELSLAVLSLESSFISVCPVFIKPQCS